MKDLKQVFIIFLAVMLDVKSITEFFFVCVQNNTEKVHEGGLLNLLHFRCLNVWEEESKITLC